MKASEKFAYQRKTTKRRTEQAYVRMYDIRKQTHNVTLHFLRIVPCHRYT